MLENPNQKVIQDIEHIIRAAESLYVRYLNGEYENAMQVSMIAENIVPYVIEIQDILKDELKSKKKENI